MRKTIYIPDNFDWVGLKEKAKDVGLSVSQYLLATGNRAGFGSASMATRFVPSGSGTMPSRANPYWPALIASS